MRGSTCVGTASVDVSAPRSSHSATAPSPTSRSWSTRWPTWPRLGPKPIRTWRIQVENLVVLSRAKSRRGNCLTGIRTHHEGISSDPNSFTWEGPEPGLRCHGGGTQSVSIEWSNESHNRVCGPKMYCLYCTQKAEECHITQGGLCGMESQNYLY